VGIVIRYVGARKWKSLTRKEANALRGSGIDIAAVYETKADWMLAGRSAGVAAAKKARAAVIACGGPRTPFVYFACDVATSRYSAVNACLQGAASVLGADHVGIYGSYSVCENALKSGYATKAWQTEAWSYAKVLAGAALFQRAHHIDGSLGLDYDSNLARTDDIGQWGYSASGVNWTARSLATTATLNGIDFADTNSGWAVGEGGTVIRTSDGGASWTPQSAPTTATLKATRFASPTAGWAVGEAGAIAHTADGGATWLAQSAPGTATLNSVDFADGTHGWAVGEGGSAIRTTDGGASWTAQSLPTTATLNCVRFIDANAGWAVGALGTVLHTTDGGSKWTTQSAGTTVALSAVDFVDSRVGWAVGAGGKVVRTTNGGTTWTAQSSPTTAALSAVRFADRSVGWAVGAAGTILRTADGGAHWIAQTPPSTATLLSADLTASHSGWAVGAGGTLLRGAGTGLSAFTTVTGVVTDAVSGAPISGASVTIGSRLAAPTAPDGSFIAARVAPGTYRVTFSNGLYIAGSVAGVVAPAGGRTMVHVKLTPRTVTSLSKPSLDTTLALRAVPVTLATTLSPASVASSAVTVLNGWHYEQKVVTKKIKGKKKKVKVWYWRQRFSRKMGLVGANRFATRMALEPGAWRVQSKYAGSVPNLPATSATTSFVVR
jgi:photosystem II stability/assembly factor-like uncharacterized protein